MKLKLVIRHETILSAVLRTIPLTITLRLPKNDTLLQTIRRKRAAMQLDIAIMKINNHNLGRIVRGEKGMER
ncbi:unnamed protein product [Rotaria sp. Silwood2]|nr:unnamed protein product [Rotaria sp. Silwood2]CAF2685572.1 unnamed protein product [Rotaria sp. Silwood2]CAF3093784.1 unnamed protein product [Rotaria sp. Silwood2]CAF4020974.1 unnamed protein product [Rotaria sp. Silwood2]CAF4030134.1 unnamed protein product [Rotaria sp. Silwood2]